MKKLTMLFLNKVGRWVLLLSSCNYKTLSELCWSLDKNPVKFVCFQLFNYKINKLMRAIKLGLTLLFILTLVRTDIYLSTYLGDFNSFTTTTAAIPLSDLITVGNYYGCKTWVNNKCTECSKGFYFSSKGVCC